MKKNYELFVVDCEATGLSFFDHDIIELSIMRISDETQRTWLIKPLNFATISADALRVNGHKLEDITHQTAYGKENYKDPHKVIVEIENWMMDTGCAREEVFTVGQNVSFDLNMMQQMWKKCGAEDSFPFGRRMLDTMQFEILLDLANETRRDSYSLSSIIKKYGIKNEKAHTAAADVKATKEVFVKQLNYLKSILPKQ
jgi:DNA polymerase III alpha subunit (gram-positive type)